MIIYGSSTSPYVRKVIAFANEKAIAFKLKTIGIGSQDPEFREASPFGKIPALRDGDFTVSDSTAIVTYMDAVGPGAPLIPEEPRARARTIWFDEFADTILFDAVRPIFFNRVVRPIFLGLAADPGAADEGERELPPILAWLESAIPESGFLVGDRLTLADIAVASPLVNLDHLGLAPAADAYPRLSAFMAAIHARPSFATSIAKEKAFFAKV